LDVLSDLLRNVRFSGSLYFRSDLAAPWGMKISEGDLGLFHYIEAGEGWLDAPGLKNPVKLEKGDLVVFPVGGEHWIASHENSEKVDAKIVIDTINTNNPPFKKSPADTVLICGYFDFNKNINHPFIKALPGFIYISHKEQQNSESLESMIKLIQDESSQNALGSEVVIDRLTEMLFVQILRAYKTKSNIQTGYLAALNDDLISMAIRLIHEKPQEQWTVDSLARNIGMSRSAFADRFNQLVEIPPITYITNWRMHLAAQKLKESDLQMYEIAEMSGYNSEASFNKVFKKHFNLSPGKYRREAKNKTPHT